MSDSQTNDRRLQTTKGRHGAGDGEDEDAGEEVAQDDDTGVHVGDAALADGHAGRRKGSRASDERARRRIEHVDACSQHAQEEGQQRQTELVAGVHVDDGRGAVCAACHDIVDDDAKRESPGREEDRTNCSGDAVDQRRKVLLEATPEAKDGHHQRGQRPGARHQEPDGLGGESQRHGRQEQGGCVGKAPEEAVGDEAQEEDEDGRGCYECPRRLEKKRRRHGALVGPWAHISEVAPGGYWRQSLCCCHG